MRLRNLLGWIALVFMLAFSAKAALGQTRGYVGRCDGFGGNYAASGVCDGTVSGGNVVAGTTDPDGDTTDEDLIYVDCDTGTDQASCGLVGNPPCASVVYALNNVADGPGDGAEDIVCFQGTCDPSANDLPTELSGVANTRTVTASGTQEFDFEYPDDPAMIVGWDVDGDGCYPPFDTDDTSEFRNAAATRPFDLNAGAITNNYVELAHFTIADYGQSNATVGNAFRLCDGPAASPSHVFVHDLVIDGINEGQQFASGNNVFHAWTCAGASYMSFCENCLVSNFGGFLMRGTLGDPASAVSPTRGVRLQNVTATAEACDRDNVNGEVCATPALAEVAFFRTWGAAENIEILDSVFDCNVGNAADEWRPQGVCEAMGVDSCLQNVVFRNVEAIDWALLGSIESDDVACSVRATDEITYDRVYAHTSYDYPTDAPDETNIWGLRFTGNSVGQMEDVYVTNSAITSSIAVSSLIYLAAGGDDDTGNVRIHNNTLLADTDGDTTPGFGLVHLDNTAETFDFPNTLDMRNNIFDGLAASGRNVNLEVAPATSESYDYNTYDTDGDWHRAGTTETAIADWRTLTSDEANSAVCGPTFLGDGYHLDGTDSCAQGNGGNDCRPDRGHRRRHALRPARHWCGRDRGWCDDHSRRALRCCSRRYLMALSTTTWTDETLPTLADPFVEPGFVEDDFVREDAYTPEVLPITTWTDE